MMRRLLRVGLPNLMEASGFWIAQLLVLKIVGNTVYAGLPNAIAVHAVAVRLDGISYLPGFAMSTAAATLAGQYLGVGDPHRVKAATRLCWYICMAIMGSVGLLFLLAPEPLVAIVTSDPVISRDAPTCSASAARPKSSWRPIWCFPPQCAARAIRARRWSFSYLSIFCVRLPAVYLLGVVLGYGLVGIWFALCGEIAVRGIIFALRFWQGDWLKATV